MGHSHDSSFPANFEITVRGREGSRVTAEVVLRQTIPAGGLTLEVVYDVEEKDVVSVRPWRNIGLHVIDAIAHAAH